MQTLVEMDTGINNMFKIKKKDQLSEIFQLFNFVPESLELIQKSLDIYFNLFENDIPYFLFVFVFRPFLL